ncbi:hypothetical protein B566_EDAN012705 [Ephemera danica]|nr:hypothetical protein B566_EDAN012705 [Ephemera danica]
MLQHSIARDPCLGDRQHDVVENRLSLLSLSHPTSSLFSYPHPHPPKKPRHHCRRRCVVARLHFFLERPLLNARSLKIGPSISLLLPLACPPATFSRAQCSWSALPAGNYWGGEHQNLPLNLFSSVRRVKNWALKFGVDLWEFGRSFTNAQELQRLYQENNAQVHRKDGLLLIRELAAEAGGEQISYKEQCGKFVGKEAHGGI